jgi:hypothetical protein
MLVRNEQDILEENLFFHRKMGIDRFLVMNHLSTDGTLSILTRLREQGVDIRVYEQNSPKYLQAEWMTFLSREAYRLGTDWVIMSDADEFWLPEKPSLKDYLVTVPEEVDVVQSLWYNNLPVKGVSPFYLNTSFAPYIYLYKVAMRAAPTSGVSMGNHAPTHTAKCLREHSALRVMHFQHRGEASLYNKYVLGGEALANSNLPEDVGSHWRRGFQEFQRGNFDGFTDSLSYSEAEIRVVPNVCTVDTVKKMLLARGRHTSRWLEVTSKVGCGNACSYCPQTLFTSSYGKLCPKDSRILSMGLLSRMLDNVDPVTTAIHFSGFCEVFLHPEGHEFIACAHEKGFDVALFSTLAGLTEEKISFLEKKGVELAWVRLHEIPGVDRKLFEAKSKLIRETLRITRFESQPVENPISRGGSLWNPGYWSKGVTCPRFDCNVVLPNGEVFLCCSDFGLSCRVGNLLESRYDSQEFKEARARFRNCAAASGTDMLCKHCEMAIKLG